jgi:3-oxoacyl-[acyl-carrier-protein] synthase II
MRRRVAVTGVGLSTPGGSTPDEVMDALDRGRSTARPVPALDAADLPVTFACTVRSPDAEAHGTEAQWRQFDRATLLALAAAADAVGEEPLTGIADPERIGVLVGVGGGGLSAAEQLMREYADRPRSVPAYSVPRIMASSTAARLSLRWGSQGPALTYSSACASGANAIGEAVQKIRAGQLDLALAGGTEAVLTPLVVAAFANLRVLSRRNDDPGAACRPFDADRDGTVLGEGAGFLLLEEWGHAVARGAWVLGEVLGYGATSDAHHVVAPGPDGNVAARCMALALADARLAPHDIGHINAHGTATVLNDTTEALAIGHVFGQECPPVTASKGVLGHLLGAAGAVEAVISLLTADREVVPPVANFSRPDPATADLDVVSGSPRKIARSPALSNSFGFGGHNAALILSPGA